MARPEPPPPDPWDGPLSAVHDAVDNLGPWLAIWQARSEPDACARRCAADAIGAIDAALLDLHAIRAELVGQVRAADDQAAVRVDELLARTGREAGPRPYCLPGCDRLDGHDGRDPGACMRDGTVLSPPGEREGTLLAGVPEGPPGEREGGPAAKPDRPHHASSPPPPQQQGPTGIVGRGRDSGRAPREVTP